MPAILAAIASEGPIAGLLSPIDLPQMSVPVAVLRYAVHRVVYTNIDSAEFLYCVGRTACAGSVLAGGNLSGF